MKNSNDTIGNRTRDPAACNTVLNQLRPLVPLFLGRQDLISYAIQFFFTHLSSEYIGTMALKLRKVLFHILNFAHFIFKLEGKGAAIIWESLIFGSYEICCVNLWFVLSADLICSLYRPVNIGEFASTKTNGPSRMWISLQSWWVLPSAVHLYQRPF